MEQEFTGEDVEVIKDAVWAALDGLIDDEDEGRKALAILALIEVATEVAVEVTADDMGAVRSVLAAVQGVPELAQQAYAELVMH